MNTDNQVFQLCIKGIRAEYEGRVEDARAFYWQAWEIAKDDSEICVAAHYVARFQESNEEKLRWNEIALDHAKAAKDESVQGFFPSLYLNMGQSYELLGNQAEAKRYYDLAASLGFPHTM